MCTSVFVCVYVCYKWLYNEHEESQAIIISRDFFICSLHDISSVSPEWRLHQSQHDFP